METNFLFRIFIFQDIFSGCSSSFSCSVVSNACYTLYPKQYLEIQLPDVDGELKLKNSAIEGFVRCVVANHNFIKDPTIKVNSRKNKCLVHVEGQMLPSDNIIKRTQIIKDEIADGLTQFFGMNHRVKTVYFCKRIQAKTTT